VLCPAQRWALSRSQLFTSLFISCDKSQVSGSHYDPVILKQNRHGNYGGDFIGTVVRLLFAVFVAIFARDRAV
jgi:hypothetical protein